MKNLYFFFFFLFFIAGVNGQTERRPFTKQQQIADCRQTLKYAFLNNDPTSVTLWMDSLARLEDAYYAGLIWDERWLLYYWLETYGNLTTEAARFDLDARSREAYKVRPAPDSLFETIDSALYEQRYALFTQISRSFLNEEERAFTTLQLEYLLRLDNDKDAWRERLDTFMKRYPASRFNQYLLTLRPPKIQVTAKHRGGHIMLLNNHWNGDIERVMRSGFGFDFGYAFGKKRMNYLLNAAVSGQKTSRELIEIRNNTSFFIPEKTSLTQFHLGFEAGYDVRHYDKLRIWPSLGVGLNWLGPTPAGEDEAPLPDYYSYFNYFSVAPQLALNTDIKLSRDRPSAKGNYSGLRLRLGYRFLNFDKKNTQLNGNMFFFAAGWTMYHRKTIRT
jgi:hypothetical protein